MHLLLTYCRLIKVEALVASWIEILYNHTSKLHGVVEALVASWIEIHGAVGHKECARSKPLWLRGLKSGYPCCFPELLPVEAFAAS